MSAAFRTRVGKVRYRDGRELHVLRTADPLPAIEAHLLRSARKMVDGRMGRLIGHAVVVWDEQGDWNAAWQVDPGGVVRNTMLPSFVADVLKARIAED